MSYLIAQVFKGLMAKNPSVKVKEAVSSSGFSFLSKPLICFSRFGYEITHGSLYTQATIQLTNGGSL